MQNPNAIVVSGRIVYPELFEPKAFRDSKPKFSCSVLIDKQDPKAAAIAEIVQRLIKDELRGKQPEDRYFPLKNGDAEDANPDYAGCFELRCKNKRQPGVVDGGLNPILDAEKIQGGDHVLVDVSFYTYSGDFNGIGCSLNNVQWVSKGEKVIGSSRQRPEAVFEKIEVDSDPVETTSEGSGMDSLFG